MAELDDQRNLSALPLEELFVRALENGELAESFDLDAAREELLDLLSSWSEDRWAAGWVNGIDKEAHGVGGVWEVVGRVIGWPLGYRGDKGWVTWNEAASYYGAKP